MSDISDAGKALNILSLHLDEANLIVKEKVQGVFSAQEELRRAIDNRDALEKSLHLTSLFVYRETQ